MGYYFGTMKELLKNSLNVKFVLYIILLTIISIVLFAAGIVIWLLPLIFLLILFGQTFIVLAPILLIFGILFILGMALLQSIISGIGLNLAKQFVEIQPLDLGKSWGDTKPRLMALFKVNLVISIIVLIVFILAFLPLLFSLVSVFSTFVPIASGGVAAISSIPDLIASLGAAIIAIIGALVIGLFIIFIVYLIFMPFLVLFEQATLFESNGVKDSLKRAWYYAKKNYFKIWIFVLIFAAILGVIFLIGFALLAYIPIIGYIIWYVIQFWIAAFVYTFNYKIYSLIKE